MANWTNQPTGQKQQQPKKTQQKQKQIFRILCQHHDFSIITEQTDRILAEQWYVLSASQTAE